MTYSNQIKESAEGLSIFRIQDIINESSKAGLANKIVFSRPFTKISTKKFGSSLFDLDDIIDNDIVKATKEASHKIIAAWKSRGINEKEKAFWHKKSYYYLLEEEIEFIFSDAWVNLMCLYYFAFKKLIQDNGIKACVLTSGFVDECCIAAANQLKVPCIILQHGVLAHTRLDLLQNSYYTTFGDSERDTMLKRCKLDRQKIVVTGPAILDEVINYSTHVKKNNNAEIKKILIMTTAFIENQYMSTDEHFQMIESILIQLKKIKGVHITLKLHPVEKRLMKYMDLLKKLSIDGVVYTGLDEQLNYRLIAESELLINFGTTATYMAMLLDTPIVIIDVNKIGLKEFKSCDSVVFIDKKDIINISTIIAGLETTNSRKRFEKARNNDIRHLFYKADGHSSQRVVKEIQRLIKSHN
ncbi:MAG: hypothetical protein V1859_04280 [archaeon]